jgi:hypothetical protein
MGYRRSPDRISAERAWQQFVDANAELISDAGIPATATSSIDAWDDFLVHGYVVGDTIPFKVQQLTDGQYQALVSLVLNYFAAGYEFYTPLALNLEDQTALRARFEA